MNAVNGKVPQGVTIREATDQDIIEVVRLGHAFWDESPTYRGMEKDVATMIGFAYNARANPGSFFRVAVDTAGEVIGFMFAERAPYGFHDSQFAYDRLLYVTPDRRGGATARMLIEALEQWCKEHDVARILLGVTTGIHSERTVQLYNKLGYVTVGTLTMKEV